MTAAWPVVLDRFGFHPWRPPLSFHDRRLRTATLAVVIVAPVLIALFAYGLPRSLDWLGVYARLARHPLHPYVVRGFYNPPWFAVPLTALGWLPDLLSQSVNAYLNFAVTVLVVVRYGGTPRSIVWTLTSLPFATLMVYGNVEWIGMSAFLVPPSVGLILLATKPQTGALAAVAWVRQARSKLNLLLPFVAVFLFSFLVWPNWPKEALANFLAQQPPPLTMPENASLWPWLVPLGIVLVIGAWLFEDELLGVAATLCLTPYFVLHSATLLMALLAARAPRWALFLSLGMWVVAVVSARNLIFR